jgi:hypothetical protein
VEGSEYAALVAAATEGQTIGIVSTLELTATLAVTLALAGACGTRPTTGSVQGDVYVVTRTGELNRAAGGQVRLVRYSDTLRADMERVCATYGERLMASLRVKRDLSDSAATLDAETRSGLRAVLRGATLRTVPTGATGHYRFADVGSGGFALWAETELGDHHYTWWVPIRISPGDSLTRDLDNGVEADARLYCSEDRRAVVRAILMEDSARRAGSASAWDSRPGRPR